MQNIPLQDMPEEVAKIFLEDLLYRLPSAFEYLTSLQKEVDEKYSSRIQEIKRECKIMISRSQKLLGDEFGNKTREGVVEILQMLGKQTFHIALIKAGKPLVDDNDMFFDVKLVGLKNGRICQVNDIQITIKGATGSGKTTLACIIEDFLKSKGLQAEIGFDKDPDGPIAPFLRKAIAKKVTIDNLRKIEIITEQAPRGWNLEIENATSPVG